MVHLYGEDPKELANDAGRTNELFVALEENGKDMVYDRICIEPIKTWWKM